MEPNEMDSEHASESGVEMGSVQEPVVGASMPPADPVIPPPPPTASQCLLPKKPWRAALAAVVPGAGYLYLGLYRRAVLFFAAFLFGIALGSTTESPFIGFSVMFLYVFGLLDSYRQASLMNLGLATDVGQSLPAVSLAPSQARLAFGALLFGGGFLELLSRAGLWEWEWIFEYAFILAMVIGAWMVVSALRHRRQSESEELGELSY